MRVFGKPLSDYVRFEKVFLGIVAAVGLLRLGLSVAGVPDTTSRWLSMNVVIWAGVFYYGAAVHTKGFGSYKQLLVLVSLPILILHVIAVTGILLTIAGLPNVFAAPEYSGPAATNQWLHALVHLTIGMVVAPLIAWGVGSLVLLGAKRIRRPAVI